ncbi:MAG TPA: hypothetical protein VHQ22_06325 [Terriglobales bacterium]|nr:hypothetical protein [Terriglobales bacterium]
MNVGAENRNKVIAAVSLVVIAIVLMATRFSGFLGSGSSSASIPPPAAVGDRASELPAAPAPRAASGRNRSTPKKQSAAQSLDPTLRTDLLKVSEDTKYEGTGRNIFKVFVDIPKPIVNVATETPTQPTGPALPPPPPPIDLKFYGYATPAGGTKRIFLAQGEDVFIAREGDIVDRRYKVVRISGTAVEILDVLSNNRQSIPLNQG